MQIFKSSNRFKQIAEMMFVSWLRRYLSLILLQVWRLQLERHYLSAIISQEMGNFMMHIISVQINPNEPPKYHWIGSNLTLFIHFYFQKKNIVNENYWRIDACFHDQNYC